MTCELCKGAGVRQIAPPFVNQKREIGEPFISPTRITRSLWPWALCPCIMNELGALRQALVGAGILPADHWTRGLPQRGLNGSVPPELSYVVCSTRRDGYRIVSHGHRLEGLAPDGSVLRWGSGVEQTHWWPPGDCGLAEREIDRDHPFEAPKGSE